MALAPLCIVVAAGEGGVIGKGGALPWRIPEDLRHFKAKTTGHAILMGRKTQASIGRPLPDRRNIVVSRDPTLVVPGCEVAPSLEAAIALAREHDPEPRVVGGAEIYRLALPLATRIFLTEVARAVPDGDAFFPPLDPAEWIEASRSPGDTEGVVFVELVRRGLEPALETR
jgi:dihydrofolate reductase